MADIYQFRLTVDEYLSLSSDALNNKDDEKEINYLMKALELDENCVEASVRLAAAYSALGNFPVSNAVLFRAMDYNPDDDMCDRIFYLLANNFLQLSQGDVVEYYMRYFDENYVFDAGGVKDSDGNSIGNFHLAYPRGEDYYAGLLEKSYALVREHRYDDAVALLNNVDRRSSAGEAADHLTLVCLLMKNDVDRAIDTAKDMLKEHDSLSVRCTLATAYLMEEKINDAAQIVEELLKTDYTRLDDVLMLLPLLVSLEMHSWVVVYTERVLRSVHLQENTMLWLSQALWNVGQKREAVRVANRIRNVYGLFSPAEYYISLYETNPDHVEYSMDLPLQEKVERFKRLEGLLMSPVQELDRLFSGDAEFASLVEWALYSESEKALYEIVVSLDRLNNDKVRALFRRMLLLPHLTFDVTSRLVVALLGNKNTLELNLVTQDRYKEIYIETPEAFHFLPKILHDAVCYAMCDIIFTDEDPTTFIARLKSIVDKIVRYSPRNDRLTWLRLHGERIGRLRSANTLVGVLLARVYEDDSDDPRADSISRYGINPHTFDKYYKILFDESANLELPEFVTVEDGDDAR